MAAFFTPDSCHTVLRDAAILACSELAELKALIAFGTSVLKQKYS